MTLNERIVVGNPRVLLLLFCLFCVILICFAGICPYMMRKRKKIEPLDQKHWHGPCLWWHDRAKPSHPKPAKRKKGVHDPCLWWQGRARHPAPENFKIFPSSPSFNHHNFFHLLNFSLNLQ